MPFLSEGPDCRVTQGKYGITISITDLSRTPFVVFRAGPKIGVLAARPAGPSRAKMDVAWCVPGAVAPVKKAVTKLLSSLTLKERTKNELRRDR